MAVAAAALYQRTVDDERGCDAGLVSSVGRRRRARVDAGVVEVRAGDVQARHAPVERLLEVFVVGRDEVVVLVPADRRRRPAGSRPPRRRRRGRGGVRRAKLALEGCVFALRHRHVDRTSNPLHQLVVVVDVIFCCRSTGQIPRGQFPRTA